MFFELFSDIPEVTLTADLLTVPCLSNEILGTDNTVLNSLDSYVFVRKTRGLPFDLTRIPDRTKQYKRGIFIFGNV